MGAWATFTWRETWTRDLLVQLGQLAADRGLAPAHDPGEIGKGFPHAVAGLEQDQRRVDARQFAQPRAPRGLLRRQKSLEVEAIRRQCGDRKRRQHRRRTRNGEDLMSGRAGLAHQFEAGVRNQRRAGIGNQRDGGTPREFFQNLRPRRRGVVLVIRREPRRDRVAVGQAVGDAGILAGNDVDACQGLERAQRDVGEVADRRCHQIEPGGGLRRIQDVAIDGKRSAGRTRFSLGPVY